MIDITNKTKLDIKSLDLTQLKKEFEVLGLEKYRADQVYNWLHKKLVRSFDQMINVPSKTKETLSNKFFINSLNILQTYESKKDGTKKFLFILNDNKIIETVLMKYKHGNSICISSQVGCKMGCKFCASTIGGLERNLTSSEMLEQIYLVEKLTNEKISNIVIMGVGEPFDNYNELIKFIKMITDKNGLNIGSRNITVSTCGLVNHIEKFSQEGFQVNLAISLHASNDDVRQSLMPIGRKYDINQILKACKIYYNNTKRRITFEYSMVAGINDDLKYAKELAKLLKGLNCHVNLININPIKEREYSKTDNKNIEEFKKILEKNRINVTIRREMGTDINAACGQLRNSFLYKD